MPKRRTVKDERGARLVIWLPPEDLWIRKALEEFVQVEESGGLRSSVGSVARSILRDGIEDRWSRAGEA